MRPRLYCPRVYPLFGRQTDPPNGFRIVLRDAAAFVVSATELVLGLRITLLRTLTQLRRHLCRVESRAKHGDGDDDNRGWNDVTCVLNGHGGFRPRNNVSCSMMKSGEKRVEIISADG